MKENPYVAASTNPYLALDNLYLGVLQQAATKNPRNTECIRCVIATVLLLRDPLSLGDLAIFLSMTVDDIRKALHHLHSVLLIPDDPSESVRFFHKSFPDFIRDRSRCTDERFLVEVRAHEDFMHCNA